jgi:N-acetylglucosaminyl-diphospho-decaprenol L-rhamnosyltransferase
VSSASLDIVIVDYNSADLLGDCLSSIARHPGKNLAALRVTVVCNGSKHPNFSLLNSLPLNLRWIVNRENRGFAAACNQGAAGSTANYLLFLNPDTQLFENTLDTVAGFMAQPANIRVGIAGVQLCDSQKVVARTCARFPTAGMFHAKALGLDKLGTRFVPKHFMTEWSHAETRDVDQVMGAFFLVRREVFEELNGFDERFFVYFEEVDFCLRALRRGWRTTYVADAQVYHKGCGTSDQVKCERLVYSIHSRILFAMKHYSPLSALAVAAGALTIETAARIGFSLVKGSPREVGEVIRAWFKIAARLPRGRPVRTSS